MRFTTAIRIVFAYSAAALAQDNLSSIITNLSLSNASALKVPPILDNVTNTVTFPVYPGTDLTDLAPTFDLVDGDTSDPASGTTEDLSSSVTYNITLADSSTITWTFSAVYMGSPALPGVYADPNIVVFNKTYYIYTTTDGFAGWGGQTFYVWYSSDLVHWERTTDPILTLNGTSGNVPWANGNAWAPTIAEKDGTYYLYFSGNNTVLNWKTIGVATAPSPLGPFTAAAEPMIDNTEPITTNQVIDPAAFTDPKTGVHYLFWGNGKPLMAELADNMTSLKPNTTKNVVGLTNFTEASFVVYRKPYYHYTYSNGNTGAASYYVGYATAENITGPWTYRGKILQQDPQKGILATGSSSNVRVPGTDDWYIAYHRFQIPGGDGVHRETCLDHLYFDNSTGLIQPVHPTLEAILQPERVASSYGQRVY